MDKAKVAAANDNMRRFTKSLGKIRNLNLEDCRGLIGICLLYTSRKGEFLFEITWWERKKICRFHLIKEDWIYNKGF